MKLLDTLLGKTKPVQANLDALFSLPAAAITLETTTGLAPSGRAGVCFKPPAGQSFEDMQHDLEQLLQMPDDAGTSTESLAAAPQTAAPQTGSGTPESPGGAESRAAGSATIEVRHEADAYGYRWIILGGTGIDDLVTRVHMVHSSLSDAGWGTQLLCSVVGFVPGGGADDSAVDQPVYLIYLAKQGTFYPFAPSGKEKRDVELELRLKSFLAGDLAIEPDLDRWFPIWDLPIA